MYYRLAITIIWASVLAPAAGAASVSGTWSMGGFDATNISQPRPGIVDIVNRSFSDSVYEVRSGTAFSIFSGPPGFNTPNFYGDGFNTVTRVEASATQYGDLKAASYADNHDPLPSNWGQPPDYEVVPGVRILPIITRSVSAGVSITSNETIKYLFKPTLSKPLPDELALKFSVEAELVLVEPDFPWQRLVPVPPGEDEPNIESLYFSDYARFQATAQGRNAYYLRANGLPYPDSYEWYTDYDTNSLDFREVVLGADSQQNMNHSTTLYVKPEYTLPAVSSSPFVVAYKFQISLEAETASTYADSSLADATHTMRFDSITFLDGTTPESRGYELEFESGHISPNLRPVPEPATIVLLGLAAVWGCAFYRKYRCRPY